VWRAYSCRAVDMGAGPGIEVAGRLRAFHKWNALSNIVIQAIGSPLLDLDHIHGADI
jgi:hypothetical protein